MGWAGLGEAQPTVPRSCWKTLYEAFNWGLGKFTELTLIETHLIWALELGIQKRVQSSSGKRVSVSDLLVRERFSVCFSKMAK